MSDEELGQLVTEWLNLWAEPRERTEDEQQKFEEEDQRLANMIDDILPGFTYDGVSGLLGSDVPEIIHRIQKYKSSIRVMEAGKEVKVTFPFAQDEDETTSD